MSESVFAQVFTLLWVIYARADRDCEPILVSIEHCTEYLRDKDIVVNLPDDAVVVLLTNTSVGFTVYERLRSPRVEGKLWSRLLCRCMIGRHSRYASFSTFRSMLFFEEHQIFALCVSC
jgi:hypothetical protein